MNDNSFRIIVIDDNPSIHHDFIKILQPSSYSMLDKLNTEIFGNGQDTMSLPQFEIDVASQGQEGVEKIKKALEENNPYALAFVDIRMPPGWDGIETIKHIWKLDKDIQVVICTAYSDYSWEETIAHLGKTDNLLILKKPFDNISVRQLACALTTKWQLKEDTRDYTKKLQQQITEKTLSLQESLSLLKSTFESSSDGIIIINNSGEIMDYNNKLISLLKIPQAILDSKNEEHFLEHIALQLTNHEEFILAIRELKSNPEKTGNNILQLNSGKIIDCYFQPHKIDKHVVGYILDFRDITQRAKLEEELKYQANHDALTGLANRIKLLDQMKSAIKQSTENKSSFAVLFIDFDRFKLVNDSLSHAAGDELLKKAADRLKHAIRYEDTLARIGGDEFVIILMGISEKNKNFDEKIIKLLNTFQTPFNILNKQITLTTSIGVSVYPKDGTTPDLLLRNADVAMYHAKASKGNNFNFYSPEMSIKSIAMLDQEMELRHAIANQEFVLCYQPELDLANEKLIAVEALIRWNHPEKGLLLPIDFIPLAEETGLIIPIGDWVLRKACNQNKAWQDAGLPHIRVAINVTLQQFKQPDIVDKIKSALTESQLEPQYLEIELTENVIISNPQIIKIVTELKKLGVVIAIDDFGTGYSSLSYLHRIPLDRLKIDSSFIQHIKSARDDEAIIRAIIAMAKSLNLEVLAEGVETATQLEFLKTYQCNDVQGFYYSKPLSADEIREFLINSEKKLKSLIS